jgi:hypothetical protein
MVVRCFGLISLIAQDAAAIVCIWLQRVDLGRLGQKIQSFASQRYVVRTTKITLLLMNSHDVSWFCEVRMQVTVNKPMDA